jgi:hypothetical protein
MHRGYVGLALLLQAAGVQGQTLAPRIQADGARIVGSTLLIEAVGVSIELPPQWFGAKDSMPVGCGHRVSGSVERRLATSRVMLDSLRNAKGEWDETYSAVSDSILPFGDLLAQVGPRPFGAGGCFAALQMRVYSSTLSPTDISQRAAERGVRTAQSFFPSATVASRDSVEWHIDHLRWGAWYHDYGAPANVEIFTTVERGRTIGLVFLWADGSFDPVADKDRDFILKHYHH